MTDAAATSRANPGLEESVGAGGAERFGAPAVPGSGAAADWPQWPGAARPAGWFLPAPGEAAPPGGPGSEPARTEPAGPYAEPPTRVEPAGPAAPVVGPTPALRGRAGGPGFIIQPDADTPVGEGAPSGWQRAHGVWRGSGIRWEESAGHAEQAFAAGPSASAGPPGASAGPAFLSAPAIADAPPSPGDTVADDTAADEAPTRVDLRVIGAAPDRAAPPAEVRPQAVVQGASLRTGEAGERFRAWNDSVREASAPPAAAPGGPVQAQPAPRARHRNPAWSLVTVGVPAAVIVTVGTGAFMMLTGQSGGMLTMMNAGQGPRAHGAVSPGQSAAAPGGANGRGSGFGGYSGQHGAVTVSSFASSADTRLAVGSADGHPAIWRLGAGGTWSIVSAGQPAAFTGPGPANLTGVAAGRAGWIAVGESAAGRPVVLTSPDGVSWHEAVGPSAFNMPGLDVTAVAAGADGYVVVGQQVSGPRRFAAMWWSPNLRDWVRAGNGNLDGRLGPSAVYGVTATAAGFTAVGTHSGHPMTWTTRTGQSWVPHDLPLPGGAASAALRFAAVSGGTVVAAGEAGSGQRSFPFAVISRDGGQEWLQAPLPAPGGGTVTALTASGTGFVAAGLAGPAGARHPVTWTSSDGGTWSAAAPARGGDTITALSGSGDATLAASQQHASAAPLTLPAP